VEDDPAIVDFVQDGGEEHGRTLTIAGGGDERI
jgi:hypothetical protein